MLLFILFLFPSVILGVVKIGGPWTRSMKVVHGPGPRRGSMFCTFPLLARYTPSAAISFETLMLVRFETIEAA